LGGVEFPQVDGKGLDGHSDADVALHALCDALLGATGQPDIGHLFPNSDPVYRGISSLTLLEKVRDRIEEVGAIIGNVDIVIVAEQPKISPQIDRMREAISIALQIDRESIGIKATTNEGLDAVGECKGIVAHAVATVFK
jgi:2-C-methyl-D-erythritol 2,4-cyclodiphosphate synthase